jgi:uncharacterized protein YjeT (DUF2065 family)
MGFLQKINEERILRIALGIMFIYSGLDLFSHPVNWVGYVPKWFADSIGSIFSIETYLRFQGLGELAIGILFLAWFSGIWGVRVASLLASLEMFLILLFVGVDLITFRDIGVLGASLAMVFISFKDKVKPTVEEKD